MCLGEINIIDQTTALRTCDKIEILHKPCGVFVIQLSNDFQILIKTANIEVLCNSTVKIHSGNHIHLIVWPEIDSFRTTTRIPRLGFPRASSEIQLVEIGIVNAHEYVAGIAGIGTLISFCTIANGIDAPAV